MPPMRMKRPLNCKDCGTPINRVGDKRRLRCIPCAKSHNKESMRIHAKNRVLDRRVRGCCIDCGVKAKKYVCPTCQGKRNKRAAPYVKKKRLERLKSLPKTRQITCSRCGLEFSGPNRGHIPKLCLTCIHWRSLRNKDNQPAKIVRHGQKVHRKLRCENCPTLFWSSNRACGYRRFCDVCTKMRNAAAKVRYRQKYPYLSRKWAKNKR